MIVPQDRQPLIDTLRARMAAVELQRDNDLMNIGLRALRHEPPGLSALHCAFSSDWELRALNALVHLVTIAPFVADVHPKVVALLHRVDGDIADATLRAERAAWVDAQIETHRTTGSGADAKRLQADIDRLTAGDVRVPFPPTCVRAGNTMQIDVVSYVPVTLQRLAVSRATNPQLRIESVRVGLMSVLPHDKILAEAFADPGAKLAALEDQPTVLYPGLPISATVTNPTDQDIVATMWLVGASIDQSERAAPIPFGTMRGYR